MIELAVEASTTSWADVVAMLGFFVFSGFVLWLFLR